MPAALRNSSLIGLSWVASLVQAQDRSCRNGSLIFGITLTFARALGEFGAVLVIGGGVQGRTETATLFIYRALEERQYIGAYSAALALGLFSLVLVLGSDWLRRRKH